MKFIPVLEGAFVIELDKKGDERGFFARLFCNKEFEKAGLEKQFVQVNNSLSVDKGTLRGMHYQLPPKAETKLVRCIKGALFDVIVDLRHSSKTFGKWYGQELNEHNRTMMYVPKGFAHGFVTLEKNSEVIYLVSDYYDPKLERGLRWDDPILKISWPIQPTVISEKDSKHANFDPIKHAVQLCSLRM
jgi:dTDP-4-dehydrorhamnose 3,5-epimerase